VSSADDADLGRAEATTTRVPVLTREQRDALMLQAALDDRLQPMSMRVLMVLALKYYNLTLGVAEPSQQELAELLGTSNRRICAAVRELKERGYLVATYCQGQRWRERRYHLIAVAGTQKVRP